MEEDIAVTLHELGMLREEVTGTLEALGPGKTVRACVDVSASSFYVFDFYIRVGS